MAEIADIFSRLGRIFKELELKHVIIPGIAVIQYGFIRSTQDIDIILEDTFSKFPQFLKLLQQYDFEVNETQFFLNYQEKTNVSIFDKNSQMRLVIKIANKKTEIDVLRTAVQEKLLGNLFIARTAFKIIVIGDEGVGKTSLIRKFNVGNYIPAIGVNICEAPLAGIGRAKEIEAIKDKKIIFWDINIVPKIKRIIDKFLQNGDVIMIVFDLTSSETFESIINLIKNFPTVISNIPILILGNKKDLKEGRQVKENDIPLLNATGIFKYLEISVKTGENIDAVFEEVISMIISRQNIES